MAEDKNKSDADNSTSSGSNDKRSSMHGGKGKKIIEMPAGHPEGCMCLTCSARRVGCMCGCGRHSLYYSVLRILFMLIILGTVFCFGVKVGEYHGMFGGRYGMYSRMMGGYDGYPNVMYYGDSDQSIRMHIPAASSSTSTPAKKSTTSLPQPL